MYIILLLGIIYININRYALIGGNSVHLRKVSNKNIF